MFNVIGTIIFTILCIVTPLVSIVEGITPANAPAQIANLHTLFNIVTTLLLLPVGGLLTKLAVIALKDRGDSDVDEMRTKYLLDIHRINADKLSVSVMFIEGIKKELNRMLQMAHSNVTEAFVVFAHEDSDKLKKIEEKEEYVDFLNKEISKYITSVVPHESSKGGSKILNSLFSITSNIERISDHAMNIAGYSRIVSEKEIHFSMQAKEELRQIQSTCQDLFSLLAESPADIIKWHEKVACIEQKIDDMTIEYKNNMYDRIHDGTCSDEGSILFSEMLTDFERIGDHGLKISNDMLMIKMNE